MSSVLYLDDYGNAEELELRQLGYQVSRVESRSLLAGEPNWRLASDRTILRGPRRGLDWYVPVIRALRSAGVDTYPDEASLLVGSDYRRQRRAFGTLAPTSAVFEKTTPPEKIMENIGRDGLQFPLFVRTDVESLAKYTGVASTVLQSCDIARLRFILQECAQHIQGYQFLIFKEMIGVKEVASGEKVEIRTIGVNGGLAFVDTNIARFDLAAELMAKFESFSNECFDQLKSQGGLGPYFLDVGISATDRLFVVECKNFVNGHIRSVSEAFRRLFELLH